MCSPARSTIILKIIIIVDVLLSYVLTSPREERIRSDSPKCGDSPCRGIPFRNFSRISATLATNFCK